jgi:predicted DNA binding CopG/RHH family protein
MTDLDKLDQKHVVLTKQELTPGFEMGYFEPRPDYDYEELRAAAPEDTGRRDSRLNIRINSKDLAVLQQQALDAGLPLHTYVASVVHRHAQSCTESPVLVMHANGATDLTLPTPTDNTHNHRENSLWPHDVW